MSAYWEGPSWCWLADTPLVFAGQQKSSQKTKTTRGQICDRDLSLDKLSKHEHLHPKVFNVKNAEMCLTCCQPKTEPFKEPRVTFIHCVEKGGLLSDFV